MTEFLDPAKTVDDASDESSDRQPAPAVAASAALNHSIHDIRLGDPDYPNFTDVPCCIYFYYIRINTNGRLFVTHHFYPGGNPNDPGNPAPGVTWPAIARDPALLTPILEMLARDARPLGSKAYLTGSDFDNIVWKRKSYLAFFIDEASWTVARTDGVQFITAPKGGVPGTPNHSFFDALALPLTMPIRKPKPGGPITDQRSALVCINHMKVDEAGNDLQGGDDQLYHFQMAFDVAFESGTKGMTVIFDPDGTNMGPPLPPP